MPDGESLHYVAIYCDRPGCPQEHRHDIPAPSLTRAYARARAWGMEHAGWSRVRTTDGSWLDLCPEHTPSLKEHAHAH